jgi:hypothetical protein
MKNLLVSTALCLSLSISILSSPSMGMDDNACVSHVTHALTTSTGVGLPPDEPSSVRVTMPRQPIARAETSAEREEIEEILHGPYAYVLETQSSDGSGSVCYYKKDGYEGPSLRRTAPLAPHVSIYSTNYYSCHDYPVLYVLRRLNPGEAVDEGAQQEIDGRTNIIAWLPMEDPGAFIRRHLIEPDSLLAKAMHRLVAQGHRRSTNYLDDLAPSTAPDQSTPLPALAEDLEMAVETISTSMTSSNSSSALISEVAATESTPLPVPPLAVVGSLFPIGSY